MIDPTVILHCQADIYAIGLMYWALISDEDIFRGACYQAKLKAAKDLNMSPSQRFVSIILLWLLGAFQ